MPNYKKYFEDPDDYRIYRNLERHKYYSKTANKYSKRKWTSEEDKLVLAHTMTDTELSTKIGRSVGSIQKRRCRLNKVECDK